MDRRSTDSTRSRRSAQPTTAQPTSAQPTPSPSKQSTKANWTDNKTQILLQIMTEEIDDGNKVNGQFTHEGWSNICAKFEERTGLTYNKNQLKNRSSQLRVMYSRWKKLNDNASGLGLDPETGAILADDEWWNTQSQGDPEVLKFRTAAPKFLDLMSRCYDGTYATGKHTYIPFRYRGETGVNQGPSSNAAGDAYVNSQGVEANEQQPQGTSGPSSGRLGSAIKIGQVKRKRSLGGSSRLSSAERISDNIEKIANCIDTNSAQLHNFLNTEDPNLKEFQEALELFNTLPGIPVGSDFHARSLIVLHDRVHRWTFMNVVSKWPAES